VVLVESLQTPQLVMVMSMLVLPRRALLRVELLSLREVPSWLFWVEVF